MESLKKQTDCPKPDKEITDPAPVPTFTGNWVEWSDSLTVWTVNELKRAQLDKKWHEEHNCYPKEDNSK